MGTSKSCLSSGYGGRCREDHFDAVHLHSAVDQMWLTMLLSCLDQAPVEGPLAESLSLFADEAEQAELAAKWKEKQIALSDTKLFECKDSGAVCLSRRMPEYTQALAVHYEVLYSYTCQRPNLFQRASTRLNDRGRMTGDASNGFSMSDEVMSVAPWLQRIMLALRSLPSEFDYEGDLFRGVKFQYSRHYDLSSHFKIGGVIALYTLKSFTTKQTLMDDDVFCGKEGDRTIFIIRNAKGKLVAPLSHFPKECEVLLPIGTMLAVTRVISGTPTGSADIVEFRMLTTGEAAAVGQSVSNPMMG